MNLPFKIPFDLSKIEEKNKPFVLAGVLIAVFIVDYFFFMQPFLIKNLIRLNPEIDFLSKDVKQTKENLKHLNEYQAQIGQLRSSVKTIGSKILLKQEIPAILENISKIATECDVKINQIVPLRENEKLVFTSEDAKYYSLPILVNARGGYHNIGRFISRIENDKIFMSMIDFDITSNSDDPVRHSAKITIKSFVRDAEEKDGK